MKKRIIVFKNEHELVTIIKRVLEKLIGNAAYANPPAALAELEKLLPELMAALVKAKSRDKEWIAIKNNKKAIALSLLDELAAYVLAISNGDPVLILSSGFEVTGDASGSERTSVEILEVILAVPGEATLRVKNQKGTVSYIHQYTTEAPGANTMWHSVGSTTGSYTFTGLVTDKRYWFRVVAVGRKGQQAFSPVVSRSIQ